MLKELEIAHIYIAQISARMAELEAKVLIETHGCAAPEPRARCENDASCLGTRR